MVSIKELGEKVVRNATLIDQWLVDQNAKPLSFDQDADAEFPTLFDHAEIDAARTELLDDTETLNNLIAGPGEIVRRICWGSVDVAVQQCLYRFKFLPSIPLGKGISYDELSKKVGLSISQVKAVVRQSAMNRILSEDGPDRVIHTASSALLLRSPVMMDWYGFNVTETMTTFCRYAEALEKFQGSDSPQDCAFSLAFSTPLPLFQALQQDPDRRKRFDGTMKAVGEGYGLRLEHVVNGYPWAQLGDASVVDVGGSLGFLTVALAEAHPNLVHLVVQDYNMVVVEGAARLPSQLSTRVTFQEHNFFNPQTKKGADVYIMRHVLHDWSDEDSANILRQIVPAMKPTSKILLVEVVVMPSKRAGSRAAERYMRNSDLAMHALLNTHERSLSEWEQMIRSADSCLEVTGVFKPQGSWDSGHINFDAGRGKTCPLTANFALDWIVDIR